MLPEKYIQALIYAAELHSDQYRKGSNVPYLTHLMTVSSYVFEYGGTVDQAIAGLLHDAIEDQSHKTSYGEIENRFGVEVSDIVRACTDAEISPKPPWEERKRDYLSRLSKKSDFIKLVVACDKLHNAECIVRDAKIHGESLWGRFSAPPERILWYYEGIVTALDGFDSPVVAGLKSKVDEMRSLVSQIKGPSVF